LVLVFPANLRVCWQNLLICSFFCHCLGPSGPEVRGNHPEAFERLMQMEMSARSKQQQVHHQAMVAGPVPGGMYGHELDTKLRYR